MKQQTKFKQTEIGKIPEEWEVKELGRLGEIKTGRGTKKLESGKYQIIGSNGFLGYTNDERSLVECPLIFTGRVGTIGQINYLPEKKVWLSDNTLYFKTKDKNLLDFIYYFLKKINFSFLNVGSTQPLVKQSDFKRLAIPIPPGKEEMQSIAKILSSLDAKIELNNKMNKTLEAIGQALFKKWFVDERKEEWEEGNLGDFIFVERGLSYKGSGLCEDGVPLINLGNIAPKNNFKYEGLKFYSGKYKKRNLVRPGDLIIANTDITQKREVLGSCLIVPSDLGANNVLFTHHIYAIRNKDPKKILPKYFLSYLLQTPEYRERATGFATGTTVLALPEDAILNFEFAMPDKKLLDNFEGIVGYLQEKSSSNILESRKLSKIRDILLPKLMSGVIRVK